MLQITWVYYTHRDRLVIDIGHTACSMLVIIILALINATPALSSSVWSWYTGMTVLGLIRHEKRLAVGVHWTVHESLWRASPSVVDALMPLVNLSCIRL